MFARTSKNIQGHTLQINNDQATLTTTQSYQYKSKPNH